MTRQGYSNRLVKSTEQKRSFGVISAHLKCKVQYLLQNPNKQATGKVRISAKARMPTV